MRGGRVSMLGAGMFLRWIRTNDPCGCVVFLRCDEVRKRIQDVSQFRISGRMAVRVIVTKEQRKVAVRSKPFAQQEPVQRLRSKHIDCPTYSPAPCRTNAAGRQPYHRKRASGSLCRRFAESISSAWKSQQVDPTWGRVSKSPIVSCPDRLRTSGDSYSRTSNP